MATAETGKKICIVCGKDVAGQPRVKDERGRYLCAGECQAKAKAAAEAAKAKAPPQASAPPRSAPAAPPKMAKADAGSLLGNLIDDSPMMKAANCESCGNPMPGGAKICTRCGFNTETGKALKTAVIIEKKDKNEPKAPKVKGKYGNKYAGSEVGPSFPVLLLIVIGVIGVTGALGFISPIFGAVAVIIAWGAIAVGGLWGVIDAFVSGEMAWGIASLLLPFALLFYLLLSCDNKWPKAIYLGGLVGLAIAFGLVMSTGGLESLGG